MAEVSGGGGEEGLMIIVGAGHSSLQLSSTSPYLKWHLLSITRMSNCGFIGRKKPELFEMFGYSRIKDPFTIHLIPKVEKWIFDPFF